MEISASGGYRALLGRAAYRRIAVADVCARLPQGMLSVALLLTVTEHRPVAVAGLALSGYTLGQAVTSPYRGRLADRYGLALVAALCLVGYVAALAGLAVTAGTRVPAWVVVLTGTVAGFSTPPLSPGMRGLWSAATPPFLRHTAFALDAAVFDVCYIAGPALAGTVASGTRPAAALGLVLLLAGVAVLVLPRARPRRPVGKRSRAGVLRRAELRRLLLAAALANFALSAVEVALTGFARREHAVWAAGPLLAGVSVGSVLGSLALGRRGATGGTLAKFLGGYALGLLVLAAATYVPPLLAVAAPVAGLCLGPTLATVFGAVAAAAPEGAATETQSWLNTIMSGGAAAGAAVAGLVAGHPVAGLGLAAVSAALGAGVAVGAPPGVGADLRPAGRAAAGRDACGA